MNVTGTFHNDAQITESVLINTVEKSELMNSKSEWNYVHIPRTVAKVQGMDTPKAELRK